MVLIFTKSSFIGIWWSNRFQFLNFFFFASAITEFDLLDWLEIEMQNETEQIQVA